jgi:hypothetical protein
MVVARLNMYPFGGHYFYGVSSGSGWGGLPTRVQKKQKSLGYVYSRVVYRGGTGSFFGIGILPVSDLLDFGISVGITRCVGKNSS